MSPTSEASGSVTCRRRPDRPTFYQVAWRLHDGSQASKSFAATVDDVDPER
jgi:hypothetical protein